MKLCIHCGAELQDSHKFCIKCGAKQEMTMGLQLETMVNGERVVTDTVGKDTFSTSYNINNDFGKSDSIHDYVQNDWDCPIKSQVYDMPEAPAQNFSQYADTFTASSEMTGNTDVSENIKNKYAESGCIDGEYSSQINLNQSYPNQSYPNQSYSNQSYMNQGCSNGGYINPDYQNYDNSTVYSGQWQYQNQNTGGISPAQFEFQRTGYDFSGIKARFRCCNGHVFDGTDETCICPKCQVPLIKDGYIQLYRMGSFFGCAVGMGIYIDREEYGHIQNKGSLKLYLPFGQHLLHVTHTTTRNCNDPVITLSPKLPVVYAKAHFSAAGFKITVEEADPGSMPVS